MKRSIVALGLLYLNMTSAFAYTEAVLGNVAIERNQNIIALPTSNAVAEVLISRDQYLLSYNRKTRLLNYVAWKIEPADIGHVARSNDFMTDPDLEAYLNQKNEHAVTPQDYQGTCFDRGHQCPSADRTDSVANNEMTFLMSNMVPQTPHLNRVIWEHLEQYTRSLVINQGKKVYVVAGPIFDQNFGSIGANHDIPIPSKDFKVIVILDKNQTLNDISATTPIISVMMPNLLKSGKRPLDDMAELCDKNPTTPEGQSLMTTPPNDWMEFQTDLSEIEKLSGFKLINFK